MTSDVRKICVGKIVGAHGLRGHVCLHSYTDDPADVFFYRPITDEKGERVFDLKMVGVVKDHLVVSVKGVSDRNAAEALKGTKLFVARESLPETEDNTYYEVDLVGLVVHGEGDGVVGKVTALHDYGAGAFLEIMPVKGNSFMLPFTNACVPTVDVAAGLIKAVIPEGWLDTSKPDKEAK